MNGLEPVELHFLTSENLESCRNKIVGIIEINDGKIKVNARNDIVGSYGNEAKFRLLGAMIAGMRKAPRDVVVKLKPNNEKTEIKVIVRDTLGFGSRMGIDNKLQQMMYENAYAIKDAFFDAEEI